MSLEDHVNARISFLKEQIDPDNKPIVNETFQLQIEVLRNTQKEKIGLHILHKKMQLENCRNIRDSDRLFTELEALEWLQRQVAKSV
jgi:hypothetical protein